MCHPSAKITFLTPCNQRVGTGHDSVTNPRFRVPAAATPLVEAANRLRARYWWSFSVAGRLALPIWFGILSVNRLLVCIENGWVAIDLRIYRHAAEVALAGGNPWAAEVAGFRFAAPPPTLVPYLVLAWLPEPVAYVLSGVTLIAAALLAVRRLRLPIWWLLFPPIADSLIVQNPDVAVLALLLLPGPIAGLGPVVKVYGAVPLLLQRRWPALLVAALGVIPSIAMAPLFISQAGEVASVLEAQAVGLSAWGTWLLLPTILALVVVRGRGSSWLAVPALWPDTQLHYSCLALPVVATRPLLAAALSLGVPGLIPASVIAWAVAIAVRRRLQAQPPGRN